jgi:tetratricopeptide (TPR) repeat protein
MARSDRNRRSPAPKATSSYWPWAIIALAIFVLYGRSLSHGFVLDDDLYILQNPLVQQGVAGIPQAFTQGSLTHFAGSNFQVYRPVTMVVFALQKSIFGNDAGAFHLVSLMLYAGVCILVLGLFESQFKGLPKQLVWLTALLFIIHPIHTEVVANVKGQDELLAALFCLGALRLFARAVEAPTNRPRLLVAGTVLYALALFSKESAAAFLAVIAIYAWTTGGVRDVRRLGSAIPFGVALAFFLLARHAAIGHIDAAIETSVLENVLYGAPDALSRAATVASILWMHVKLMFFPHPLSWDYSYNQLPVTSWAAVGPWLGVVAIGALVVASYLFRTRKPGITFGLLFFLVMLTPTANIFFLNGTTFAERSLFLPSVGFIAAVMLMWDSACHSLSHRLPSGLPRTFAVALVLVFSGLTMARVGDWGDELALHRSGVRNAPNSSRTRAGLGTAYMNLAEREPNPARRAALVDSAITHLQKSVAIMPDNWNANYKLGLIMAMQGDTATAVRLYERSIAAKPSILALINLGSLHAAVGRTGQALTCFGQALQLEPRNKMALTNLCLVHLRRGDLEECISYGQRALAIDPGLQRVRELLATAHEQRGEADLAATFRSPYKRK